MQYIPSLIWLHLSARQTYPEVETLLLSLYNLEASKFKAILNLVLICFNKLSISNVQNVLRIIFRWLIVKDSHELYPSVCLV